MHALYRWQISLQELIQSQIWKAKETVTLPTVCGLLSVSASPRYFVTAPAVATNCSGRGPTDCHISALGSSTVLGKMLFDMKTPPLRRCRMRFAWVKASAMSLDGACRLLWMFFALIIVLKDSNASVANKIAGPNWRIWHVKWINMWNLGLLNHSLVQRAVRRRNPSILVFKMSCRIVRNVVVVYDNAIALLSVYQCPQFLAARWAEPTWKVKSRHRNTQGIQDHRSQMVLLGQCDGNPNLWVNQHIVREFFHSVEKCLAHWHRGLIGVEWAIASCRRWPQVHFGWGHARSTW